MKKLGIVIALLVLTNAITLSGLLITTTKHEKKIDSLKTDNTQLKKELSIAQDQAEGLMDILESMQSELATTESK